MKIIKRSGQEVDFNPEKIKSAISRANLEVKETERATDKEIEQMTDNVVELCEKSTYILNVEDIQELVETEIMNNRKFDLAKVYIRYRYKHSLARKVSPMDSQILSLVNLDNEELKTENSNKNPVIVSTQRDYIAGEVSKDISKRLLLPEHLVKAHEEGIIHIHDLDYYIQDVHNCSLVNIEDMLQNGTVISGKKIDTPNKFSTACNITTQIIAKVASSQFGGQTITLAHLAPFVQRSRDKFRKKVREEYAAIGLNLSDEQVNAIAEMRVNDDIEQGVQTLQYQILTLMTCNGQSPFVTVFMYLNEVEDPQTRADLKTVIKEVLRQRMIGVKNEKGVYVSPAFPKLIYVTDEDNIWEGTPDFDVTMMAAQCSAKRMVPDYISAKKCKELKEGNVFPCMGCVDGDEVITYKLLSNLYVESFSRMWNRVSLLFKVKLQHKGDPHLYMDVEGVEIYDKENGFVEVKRMIKNLSSDWVRITFSNGRMLQCTTDHPLPVVGKGRTFVRDLNIGDRVPLVNSQFTDESFEMDPEFAWALGVIVCDGCYDRQMNVTIAMEGEDEIADALESILKKVYGSEMILKEWHRGKKGDYKELRFSNRIRMEQDMKELFGGTPKKERQIPNVIFRTNLETRLSFLGGLIDADGYINASGTISTIQLGSTNKELALQQMMLMQSCGINARMYKNYYKKGSSKIRYRVEGDAIPELAQYIKCEKKRSNIKNTERTNKSNVIDDDASITSIEYLDGVIDWSYDVTTESDYFDVSGIYSHNCRSFLHPWYDENGKPKFYGRFNQGKLVMPL